MNQSSGKEKQQETKTTTTQRNLKRKVGLKASGLRFCTGKGSVGALHVAVYGAEGKAALPSAE